MEFQQLVNERKSIRKYIEADVNKNDIETIIKCAQMAPSWKNTQTGRYYVALSDESVNEVFEALPDFNQNSSKNACYIVSTFKQGLSGQGSDKQDLWGSYDLGLQNAYLVLKAKELGYDTLIMGLRDEKKLREYFNIADDEIILPVIAIGKTDQNVDPRSRKNLDDILVIK